MDFRVEAKLAGNGNEQAVSYDFKADSLFKALVCVGEEVEPKLDELEKSGLKIVDFKFLRDDTPFLSK